MFKCNICFRTYTRRYNMERHLDERHEAGDGSKKRKYSPFKPMTNNEKMNKQAMKAIAEGEKNEKERKRNEVKWYGKQSVENPDEVVYSFKRTERDIRNLEVPFGERTYYIKHTDYSSVYTDNKATDFRFDLHNVPCGDYEVALTGIFIEFSKQIMKGYTIAILSNICEESFHDKGRKGILRLVAVPDKCKTYGAEFNPIFLRLKQGDSFYIKMENEKFVENVYYTLQIRKRK